MATKKKATPRLSKALGIKAKPKEKEDVPVAPAVECWVAHCTSTPPCVKHGAKIEE